MSQPLMRYKHLDQGAMFAELNSTRFTSITSYAGSNTGSTMGTSPTQTSATVCFTNIYNEAISLGYSSQQAAQIAGAAVAAYGLAMSVSGTTLAQAEQAATAGAIAKVCVIAGYELISGNAGAWLEAAEFAAALGAALGGQSTSSQQSNASSIITNILTSLGLGI